jgi:hypothetical protein
MASSRRTFILALSSTTAQVVQEYLALNYNYRHYRHRSNTATECNHTAVPVSRRQSALQCVLDIPYVPRRESQRPRRIWGRPKANTLKQHDAPRVADCVHCIILRALHGSRACPGMPLRCKASIGAQLCALLLLWRRPL